MVALKGSDRQPYAHAVSVGPAHPDERLEITLVMHPTDPAILKTHLDHIVQGTGQPLSHDDYATNHATSDADVQIVKTFAANHHLTVVSVNTHAHRVVLEGTVAQANAAFNVDLHSFAHAGGTYRGRVGEIHIPDELVDVVAAVLGLDNRPVATPHFRPAPNHGNVRWHTSSSSFYPTQVAALYDFPAGTGKGQSIALIELGGGYRSADLTKYFVDHVGLSTAPKVKAVSVDHGLNAPTGDPNGPDGEVMLDIEVVGAVAPEATIIVYFTPNTDAGFLNAITTAMHDPVNKPSIISISWGGPENYWTKQAMTAFDAAFAQAAVLGITVTVASGDNGSSDGETDGQNHVDFPASSPHVLACGGTNIQVNNDTITKESVWNNGRFGGAGGGGMSAIFAAYDWQKTLMYEGHAVTRRGVPDVAGDADPASGYIVLVDGQTTVIGGTSAVAPLWAALIARINANLGKKVGWVHPTLYGTPSAFHDITIGNNGHFAAASGWDPASGLGSPNGTAVAALFK